STGAPTTTVYNKNIITLGRGRHNDVVLDRPEVSDVHARLRVDQKEDSGGQSLYITDLGSSNGTLVENNALKPDFEVRMGPNERIIIGNFLIKPTVIKDGLAQVSEAPPPKPKHEPTRRHEAAPPPPPPPPPPAPQPAAPVIASGNQNGAALAVE